MTALKIVSVQLELSIVNFQHCGVGVPRLLLCLHASNGQADSYTVAEASLKTHHSSRVQAICTHNAIKNHSVAT